MTDAATNILIVDDDAGGRYLKARILRRSGYHADGVATGHAAIEHCITASPDLVLLDMRLPDMHGVEVCRQIKSAFPGIAVLQTSAAITSPRERAQALDGGADVPRRADRAGRTAGDRQGAAAHARRGAGLAAAE